MWDRRTESAWLPWFRGEENADWPAALEPKLRRTKHKLNEVLRQEQGLRLEFKRVDPFPRPWSFRRWLLIVN
jgi:hypothetical protein